MITKKRFFGILLGLALMLGLMPGMSNTAYAVYTPKGLEQFIPVLDNEGNIASYDVSIKVDDTNADIQRTVRLLFSALSLEEIKAKQGWSNITNDNTEFNCYLSDDQNKPVHGSQINVSDVGIDTQDKTYTTPSSTGTNTLNFEFNAVSLDINTSYYVYFILRTAKGPDRTIYRIIGDSFGPLKPMTINYYKQDTNGSSYTSKVIHTHYISGSNLDVSKLGTVPTGYHLNTSKSTSNGNWDGSSAINIYYDLDAGVSLTPDTSTITVDSKASLNAAVIPDNIADKTVKWSVGGTNASVVKLFTDETCGTEVGAAATSALTVYVKGISPGSATVTVTSNADSTKSASCVVTVNKADAVAATVTANNRTYDGTEKSLVTVDDSTLVGGTMQYALGTDATTEPEPSSFTYTNKNLPTGTDAGTYYVWYMAEGDASHNDTVAAGPVTVTISPKSITGAAVTLDKTQLTSNGSEQSVSVTGVTIDGMTLTAVDYDVSGNTGTNKGDYTVTVTGKGNYKDSATAAWKIVDKAMTVSAENVTVDYDGNPHRITVTVTEPASGATVKYGRTAGAYDLDTSPEITQPGTLTVYFQVTAPNYTDYTGKATVTVTEKGIAVTSITLEETTTTLTKGEKVQLKPTIKPDNAIKQDLVWKSSDEKVATVDENGKVTAVGKGTATITVTATNDTEDTGDDKTAEITVTVTEKGMELSVQVDDVKRDASRGIPSEIKELEDDLEIEMAITIQGENDTVVTTVEPLKMTIKNGEVTVENQASFDGKIEDLAPGKQTVTVSVTPKAVVGQDTIHTDEGDVKGPVKWKYELSAKGEINEVDGKGMIVRIYLIWDDGSRPEVLKVYALPEDEIGAYRLNDDGTKEYLLFHTYDICMSWLGSDELCRGYERCFHKESPFVNPFVNP